MKKVYQIKQEFYQLNKEKMKKPIHQYILMFNLLEKFI